ncbi:N-acetylmuramoyl-L-alanine amidase family protein [Anaerosporobacter sp.]
MPLRVCIDAGHGGKDQGAVNGERYEKDDTLRLALQLGKILRQNGVDVVYTRSDDVYSSPVNKAKITNLLKADYLISIHRNGALSKKTSGVVTFVYNKKGTKHRIATNINNSVAALGFNNRGVKSRKNLAVLNRTDMPAILVNIGFITNDSDNMLFENKFNEIVEAVAKSFLDA